MVFCNCSKNRTRESIFVGTTFSFCCSQFRTIWATGWIKVIETVGHKISTCCQCCIIMQSETHRIPKFTFPIISSWGKLGKWLFILEKNYVELPDLEQELQFKKNEKYDVLARTKSKNILCNHTAVPRFHPVTHSLINTNWKVKLTYLLLNAYVLPTIRNGRCWVSDLIYCFFQALVSVAIPLIKTCHTVL